MKKLSYIIIIAFVCFITPLLSDSKKEVDPAVLKVNSFLETNKGLKANEINSNIKNEIQKLLKNEHTRFSLLSALCFKENRKRILNDVNTFDYIVLKDLYFHMKELVQTDGWKGKERSLQIVVVIESLIQVADKETLDDIFSFFENIPNPSFSIDGLHSYTVFGSGNGLKGNLATRLIKTRKKVICEKLISYFKKTSNIKTKRIIVQAFIHTSSTPIENYSVLAKMENLTTNELVRKDIKLAYQYQTEIACSLLIKHEVLLKKRKQLLKFLLNEDVRKNIRMKWLNK